MTTNDYLRLCNLLHQSGYSLILLSGPSDSTELSSILKQLPFTPLSNLNDHTVASFTTLLQRDTPYIAHDSGLGHLAGLSSDRGVLLSTASDHTPRHADNSYYRFRPSSRFLIVLTPEQPADMDESEFSSWDLSLILSSLKRLSSNGN